MRRVKGSPSGGFWRIWPPEQIVSAIDFRYIEDAAHSRGALRRFCEGESGTGRAAARSRAEYGYPAYTTSAGWFGFSDEKIRRLCHEGLAEGWTHFKLKVGGDPEDDLRRGRIVREEIGDDNFMMVDANQKWGVEEAIRRTNQLSELQPWWMEEPTNPDDILGHARIRRETTVRIATGEHCHNAVMFKQFMQAGAIDVCQIDSCRVAGVNENLAIISDGGEVRNSRSARMPVVSVFASMCSTFQCLIICQCPARLRIVS